MRAAVILLELGLVACGPAPLAEPEPFARGGAASYAEAWQIATHNSYWVDRGVAGDAFAGGTSERILDQLLADHARSLEIDIHRDPAVPGGWRVYHTVPGNGLCDDLAECLALVRAFHRAVPEHAPVTVVLELKELFEPNFDATHDVAALDALLVHELGPLLFRPAEIAARCRGKLGGSSLAECAARVGWPAIAALRGRVLVTLLGNWDATGQGTADWAAYAISGDIGERAAFPMASAWKLDWPTLPARIQELVSQDDLARAAAQSLFLQIEDVGDRRAPEWLARGGVVRMDAIDSASEKAAIARGMQLIQTDVPSQQPDDRGPAEPLRAFDSGKGPLAEPGLRLALGAANNARVFAYRQETSPRRWETAVSFGSDAQGSLCLRAAVASGPEPDGISVCAHKQSGVAAPPEGAKGTANAERLIATVFICQMGTCKSVDTASLDRTAGGAGELLSLTVDGNCAIARSARLVDPTGTLLSVDLGAKTCFGQPLVFRGVSRTASERTTPIYAFGLRADGAPVRGSDLTVVVELPAGAPQSSAGLLGDLSR